MKKEIANRFHIFGLEYFQENLPLEKQYFLNQVDLFEVSQSASESKDNSYLSPRKLFAKAGLKSILAVIQDIAEPSNLNSAFFEFIKLTASPGEFQQLNFNCYWSKSKKEGIIKKDRIDENFRKINELLTRNKLSIYNHKGFFALPKNPTAYASWYEDIHEILNAENEEIKKLKNKLNKQWIQNFKHLVKDLDLEKVKTNEPGGYLWLKNRPAENLTYGRYLEESYNSKIPISDELRSQLGILPEERGIRFLHALTHACFNYRFLDKKDWGQNTLFLSIPLLAPITNKREKKTWKQDTVNYLGQGAIFIFLKLDKKISDQKLKTLIGAIANLGKDLTYNYLLEVGLKQSKDLSKQAEVLSKHALRSAFAGILSRNGSHNLGSHVLSSLPGGFQDLQDLHNLINYVQERFDYLALVTTDFPEWTYPVYFVNDIVHRFLKQRLLLKYLAETENIGPYEYQHRKLTDPYSFEYGYLEYDLENLEIQKNKLVFYITYFKDGKERTEILTPYNTKKEISKDVLVAIPGGIVGYHAIFMILENIIRNSAKYGFGKLRENYPKNLEIHIELEEFEGEDFVEVRIWDNFSLNEETEKPLHELINENLIRPFIDPKTGEIINENLGLAEMRIASGFLNIQKRSKIGSGEELDIIYKNLLSDRIALDSKIKKKYRGFIKAYQSSTSYSPKKETYLGYKFPLPKPKDIWMMGNYPEEIKKLIDFTKNKNRVYQEQDIGKDKKFQDSDFVVIYEEDGDLPTSITYKVKKIVELKRKQGENSYYERQIVELLELFDDYPGRIIIVSDDLVRLESHRQFPEIFQKRVVTISRKVFKEQLENDNDLYLYLYRRWIDHIKFILFNHKRHDYKLELKIETNYVQPSPGIELYEYVFNEFKDIICYSITKNGFDREFRGFTKDLEKIYSDHPFFLDELRDRLILTSFDEIKGKIEAESDWTVNLFIKNWLEVSILENYTYFQKIQGEVKYIIQNNLEALFNHYLFASRNFYDKYQEGIETLPKIFKSNDGNVQGDSQIIDPKEKVLEDNLLEFLDFLNFEFIYKHIKGLSSSFSSIQPTQVISYKRHSLLGSELDFSEIWYKEALSGSQISFSLLKNIPKNKYDRHRLFFQMVENGLLRMAIFDERLYKYCKQKEIVKKRLEKGNVWVPYSLHYGERVFTMEELRMEKGKDIGEEIAYCLSPIIKEELHHVTLKQLKSIANIDILIIHQGILDKIFPQKGNKSTSSVELNRFIRKCKLKTPYVIITSGRGEPSSLPDSTKFIPYSNIQTMFMQEYPEKLLFTQILMKVSIPQKSNIQ